MSMPPQWMSMPPPPPQSPPSSPLLQARLPPPPTSPPQSPLGSPRGLPASSLDGPPVQTAPCSFSYAAEQTVNDSGAQEDALAPAGPPLQSFSSIFFGDLRLPSAPATPSKVDAVPRSSLRSLDSIEEPHADRPPLTSYSCIYFGDGPVLRLQEEGVLSAGIASAKRTEISLAACIADTEQVASFEPPSAPPMPSFSTLYFGEAANGQANNLLGLYSQPTAASFAAGGELQSDSAMPSGMSVGSALHSTGGCEPCAWFWKPQGCVNGNDCPRCHLCLKGEVKARKKVKQAKVRAQTNALQESAAAAARKVTEPAYLQLPNDPFSMSVQPTESTTCASIVAPMPEELPMMSSVPSKLSCKATKRSKSPAALSTDAESNGVISTSDAFSSGPGADGSASDDLALCWKQRSLAHDLGQCKPCAYFMYKADGCRQGDDCEFCHMCDKGELKKRRKARVRELRQENRGKAVVAARYSQSFRQSITV